MIAKLADTIGGATNEFVAAGLVAGKDVTGPEDTVFDCGVENVHVGLSDGVIDAEGDRVSKMWTTQ